ncbi:antitoxin Xre/MbcA/ParS toxin-binding domain-containing protein [Sulfitobacter sp. 1A13421]|uniref:antitoxin Xre/MbcA/ParS toxin-binding domain-containing protein n=1 Tax=Sulfitobacter sp. 1A13421 TaxID=3368595 RepID=UPI00374595A8|tara:strand:- start:306 stop:494 length:189 start_codon:yes stop_codon:yes gene_type:complete
MGEPELMAFCVEVTGSAENAVDWLTSKSPLLEGRRPIDFTSTPEGRTKIERLLREAQAGFPI